MSGRRNKLQLSIFENRPQFFSSGKIGTASHSDGSPLRFETKPVGVPIASQKLKVSALGNSVAGLERERVLGKQPILRSSPATEDGEFPCVGKILKTERLLGSEATFASTAATGLALIS